MIVLSAGMQKSGTAWYYNLTNDLLVAAGFQDARLIRERYRLQALLRLPNCSFGAITPIKLAWVTLPHFAGNTFAIKTHGKPNRALRLLVAAGIVKPTYIYRDPRDVALSALEYHLKRRSEGVSETIARLDNLSAAFNYTRNLLVIWDRWTHYNLALKVRYEDLLVDPVRELERLAEFLALDVSPETLRRVAGTYALEATNETQRELLHANRGVAGRFRQVFGPEEWALSQTYFGPYLKKMGYEA